MNKKFLITLLLWNSYSFSFADSFAAHDFYQNESQEFAVHPIVEVVAAITVIKSRLMVNGKKFIQKAIAYLNNKKETKEKEKN